MSPPVEICLSKTKEIWCLTLFDRDRVHHVALLDGVNHLLTVANHFAKHGVNAVQVRSRAVGHKKL